MRETKERSSDIWSATATTELSVDPSLRMMPAPAGRAGAQAPFATEAYSLVVPRRRADPCSDSLGIADRDQPFAP